jgi:hypothetical protein
VNELVKHLNTLVGPSEFMVRVYDAVISNIKSALSDPFDDLFNNDEIIDLRDILIKDGHIVKDDLWEHTSKYYVLQVETHESILKLAWSSLKYASAPSGEPWEVN